MVDAFYSAMEKAGGSTVGVVLTESGWPSAGKGNGTTPEIAGTYNRNSWHISTPMGHQRGLMLR
ncbi:putative glucan endo-1,3-beta-glucosidase BG5 [Vitis vinifera]|uniref:glucan endo-1,3-beta-D-glucosidase n=1 Tax=Vitis vinifera TaxID=29760 RepID=A0A438J980_VITVI|nr:putative glucan endo-1,3-beta-glucosidase BG5 [Vitis vinifera]